MTIYDSIIVAAKIRLRANLKEAFRPGELRELCGIAQGSFSPIFKGMRTDPGTAPLVHERARGLFIQLKRGLYQLSEKGKVTIGASSTIPFASPLEVEASDSLEENGYWSAIAESDDRQRTLVEVVQRKVSVVTDFDVPMFTIDEGDWPRRTQSETPSGVDAGGVFALMD